MEGAEYIERTPRLRAAGWTLAGIAVVLIPISRLSAGTADIEVLALVGASLAATLLFAAGWRSIGCGPRWPWRASRPSSCSPSRPARRPS
jgi:hypothetical protein